jgi:hypothetical protein
MLKVQTLVRVWLESNVSRQPRVLGIGRKSRRLCLFP